MVVFILPREEFGPNEHKEDVPLLIILSFGQTWLIFARFSIRSLSPSDCAESDLAYSSESNARYINVFANAAVDFENPSF